MSQKTLNEELSKMKSIMGYEPSMIESNYMLTEKTHPVISEDLDKTQLSEGLLYHIDNKIPLTNNIYRAGSDTYFEIWKDVRHLHEQNKITLSDDDLEIINETDLGYFDYFNDELVPLDFIFEEFENINEAEYNGKDVELNKPKRGGSKKYYVYTKNPKTGKVIKVSFGDTGGLTSKINNPEARKSFAARHKCSTKKDKTKPGYWACRLPRYANLLGLKSNFNGYW